MRRIALPFACAMLLAGPFCFAPLADSDTGWHVAVGRLVLGGTLQHSKVPRPHVASWALLAAVLALAPRDTRWRGLCVALVAVGGNLHAGAVFAAFVLALHALEAFWRTRRRAELAIAACAGLALLANPGVLFNARYLLNT